MLHETERVTVPHDGGASWDQTEHGERDNMARLVDGGELRTLPFRHHKRRSSREEVNAVIIRNDVNVESVGKTLRGHEGLQRAEDCR